MTDEKLLTVQEFAEALGVSAYTVRRYIKEGKIIAEKRTVKGQLKRYYIELKELEKAKSW